jgi:diadenosine tetraphosphate (Ap4A) HIT family hydrolase
MHDAPFALDPRLAADTHVVGELEFARLLLMDDARFPWLILVPRVAGASELTNLDRADQHRLLADINRVTSALTAIDRPHKLNIAALGNVVAQLHVHVIARFEDDAAWPKPVWGVGERRGYALGERDRKLRSLRAALNLPSDA